MGIKNRDSLRMLVSLLPIMVAAVQLMGQKEAESVEKYRVVYEYTAPQVESDSNGGGVETVVPSVSPDSMGVYYFYDHGLLELVRLHKRINEAMVEGPGFRIQIYAGSRMETANETKTDFLQAFHNSNMEVYKDWNPPHFWVRVGDFLSRNDAMKQLPKVRTVFPDAFVVQDKIKLPKYKKPVPHD